MLRTLLFTLPILGLSIMTATAAGPDKNISTQTVKAMDGSAVPMSKYQGKVVLIVNVASKCGLTPQYTKLQEIYDKYKDKGFVVVGFPCNQFGGQEPGTNDEIQKFCSSKYNVTFDLLDKIDVNGKKLRLSISN